MLDASPPPQLCREGGPVELELMQSGIPGAGTGVRMTLEPLTDHQFIGHCLGSVSMEHPGSKHVLELRSRPFWMPEHVFRAMKLREKHVFIDGMPSTGKASLLTRMNAPTGGSVANARFCRDGTVSAKGASAKGAELLVRHGRSFGRLFDRPLV